MKESGTQNGARAKPSKMALKLGHCYVPIPFFLSMECFLDCFVSCFGCEKMTIAPPSLNVLLALFKMSFTIFGKELGV